jgi:hypothetical protein
MVSSAGYVGLAYIHNKGLYFLRTVNNGATWSSPVLLDNADYTYNIVAATEEDGTIYLAYNMCDQGEKEELRLTKSVDFGAHWDAVNGGFVGKKLISESGVFVEYLSVAAYDDTLVVACTQLRDLLEETDVKLVFLKSLDGGTTF